MKMFKISKKNEKGTVFRKFFISYLLILLIPFIVFLGLTTNLVNTMRDNAVRETEFVIDNVMNEFSHRLESKNKLLIELNYNAAIQSLADSPRPILDVENVDNLKKRFAQLDDEKEMIYLYVPQDEILLSSRGIYNRLEQIYGSIISYGDMDWEEFEEKILKKEVRTEFYPNTTVRTNSHTYNAILYSHDITLDDKDSVNDFKLLYFLNTEFIEDELLTYVDEVKGRAGLYTKDGKLLYSTETQIENPESILNHYHENYSKTIENEAITIEMDQQIYTISESESGEGILITEINEKELYSDVWKLQVTIFIVFVIYLIIGGYFAWFFSMQNIKPLHRIIKLYKRTEGNELTIKNEYEFLEENFMSILNEKSQLENQNYDYEIQMKEIWIRELISGKYNTIEELKEGRFDDFIEYQFFRVVVIDISTKFMEMDEYNLIRSQMLQMVQRFNKYHSKSVEINLYQLALIFYSNEERNAFDEFVKGECGKLVSMLKDTQSNLHIGVGEIVEGALQISYSFVQAECAIRACMEYHKHLICYDELPRETNKYYFPEQLREMLVAGVNSGNLKQVKSILKILNIENFETRELGCCQLEQFIEEILLIVIHYKHEGCYQDEIQVERETSELNRFYKISNILLNICNARTDIEIKEKQKIQEDMKDYIDKNYMDSSLCLSAVASYFKVTESYVSYSFKKMHQVNFSTYLENKRVEEARILLLADSFTVEEICYKVGYNSPHVFRRAFRKVTGYNPSAIRKNK